MSSDKQILEPVGSPALAEGVELLGEFDGSGYRVAPQLVARADGQVVRLPTVLFSIVESLGSQQGTTNREEVLIRTAEAVNKTSDRTFEPEHIAYLVDRKLAPLGVTTRSDGTPPEASRARPMFSLRIKATVLEDSATWFLGGLFAWLYHPVFIVLTVLTGLAAEIWLFTTQDVAGAFNEVLLIPSGVLLVLLLTLASTAFHEIGHAAACRYGGAPPGSMGVGLYIVWPVFYTDVTRSYQLDRGGRLRTDLGGVYFNTIFVLGLVYLYLVSGFEPLLVAVLATNLEIIRQLLPTLRFDGYYIVSDLVGIPDLFRYIKPILTRTVLRRRDDPSHAALLAELKEWPQRVVTIWVLVVIPLLAAQLTFVAFQVPSLLTLAVEQMDALGHDIADGPDPVALAVSSFHILMLLLPILGLAVMFWFGARGTLRMIRNAQRSSRRTG